VKLKAIAGQVVRVTPLGMLESELGHIVDPSVGTGFSVEMRVSSMEGWEDFGLHARAGFPTTLSGSEETARKYFVWKSAP
jgi:hypothetical protein